MQLNSRTGCRRSWQQNGNNWREQDAATKSRMSVCEAQFRGCCSCTLGLTMHEFGFKSLLPHSDQCASSRDIPGRAGALMAAPAPRELREPRSADANTSDTVDDPIYAALATVARASTAVAVSAWV